MIPIVEDMMQKYILVLVLCITKLAVFGISDQCVKFHDNYAIFPTSPILRPVEQITLECWIKAEKYNKWGAPIGYAVDNYHDESGFSLAFNEGEMRFMIKTENMRGDEWVHNPGVEIEMNHWCHIAGVYDGQSIKFYHNGVLKDVKYVSGKINWDYTPIQLGIGAFIDKNELNQFSGCVDEVRIWNRALSAHEIKKNMDRELSGEEEGLILYLPITEEGAVIKDYSINHFDGRIVNYTNDNRAPSLAMVRPVISSTELKSTSSYKIGWTVPNQSEPFDAFYIDLARDSKFNSILPGFKNIKTLDNSYTFENIPGGENLYIRIKGRAKNAEFSAYSDPFLVNEFSTSLTIDLVSRGAKINDHFIILDDNILATKYYKFKKGTTGVNLEARLTSKLMQQDAVASLHIKGGGITDVYKLGRETNLVFSELKPGNYEVNLSWGAENKGKLENNFVFEIGENWWQNIWFQLFVLFVVSLPGYLLIKSYVVLKRARYQELLNGYVPVPQKDLVISEEEMNKYYNQLIDLMDSEKPYLESRLNIKMLGDMLDVSPNILSRIIHEKYGFYFNDFVNKYRIEEVKKQLKDKDSANLKISAIAYKCGFNSESTFFRVFKKYTGETPSSYQRKLKKV